MVLVEVEELESCCISDASLVPLVVGVVEGTGLLPPFPLPPFPLPLPLPLDVVGLAEVVV